MKRLPTIDEWEELINNCEWKWGDEKKGMNVTGPNGKSIFLSAAGYRNDSSQYDAGSSGSYWSSSLYTDYPYHACDVYFDSGGVDWLINHRYHGQSVRAVSESKQEGFIDLGLPSGLFWAECNIEGYYTYDEAMSLFNEKKEDGEMDKEMKNRLIHLRDNMVSYGYVDGVDKLESIFPQIVNNDERMREQCIHFLTLQLQYHTDTREVKECIEWLNKLKKVDTVYVITPKNKI